jgi:hypothetical protein
LNGRRQLLGRIEPAGSPLLQTPSAENLRRFQKRAVELVTGPDARRAFDLNQEKDNVRERYGRHPLGQNLLMARSPLPAGFRARAGKPRYRGAALESFDNRDRRFCR